MKHIAIPPDTTFSIVTKEGPIERPLVFTRTIIELLDHAEPFGTRSGARKAVAIENAILAAKDTIELTDDQHTVLLQAIQGFSWIPAAARVMEKAGWFDAIEKAS